MPQTRRANGDTVEDLGTKDVEFDVETAEGTVQIILPALDGDEPLQPER
jgi:hypothetical protein